MKRAAGLLSLLLALTVLLAACGSGGVTEETVPLTLPTLTEPPRTDMPDPEGPGDPAEPSAEPPAPSEPAPGPETSEPPAPETSERPSAQPTAPAETVPPTTEPRQSPRPTETDPPVTTAPPAPTDPTPTAPPETVSILGLWRADIPFSLMAGELTEAWRGVYEGKTIGLTLEFRSDGSLTAAVEEASVRSLCEDLYEALPALVAEQMNMSQEELDALLEEMGMTMEDLLDQAGLSSSGDLAEAMLAEYSDMPASAYSLLGNQLILTDESGVETVIRIQLGADTLRFLEITESDSGADSEAFGFPWTFTRVN